MGIYVRTRGRSRMLDYDFLGTAPGEFWWRSYGSVTIFEEPTIIVESDGRSWRAFVGAIGSERRDTVGSRLQFDLVITGDCRPWDSADQELTLAIIASSIEGLAERPADLIPGGRLEAQLDEFDIEEMLRSPGEQTLARAATAVRAAYSDSCSVPDLTAQPFPRRWLGGLGNADSRSRFITLAGRLLAGHGGRALMLHLVADDYDTERIPAREGDLGVLIPRPGPLFASGVRRLGAQQPSTLRMRRASLVRLVLRWTWLGRLLRRFGLARENRNTS